MKFPKAEASKENGQCNHCNTRDVAVIVITVNRQRIALCRGCAKELAANIIDNLF